MRLSLFSTFAIATGVMLAGAPLGAHAAGHISESTPPTAKPDTWPTAPNYPGEKPSDQTEQKLYPNTPAIGKPDTWPNRPQQPRVESSEQAETIYPGTPPIGKPDTWSTKPVNPNVTLVERVRQQIRKEFPDADISVMANKGVVTLFGLVATQKQKERAHELAAEIKGVTEIHNELRVG